MSGSTFGNLLRVTTFGESHGPALGVVVDGFPAGVSVCPDDIQAFLDRRRPGRSSVSTPRNEADQVELLSGIFDGRTTGSPVAMLIRNTSQRSSDYESVKNIYRPGHADFGMDQKYGSRDYRGGGRSSGRETAARVAAGALCQLLLKKLGIDCYAYTESIGSVRIDMTRFDRSAITTTMTGMPDHIADEEAVRLIHLVSEEKDSIGGVVSCVVEGMPSGIGEPVFDKLDATLSHAIMSIGAVKAVEIGDGIRVSAMRGSENNDPFIPGKDGRIAKKTNHAGGILGGMSDSSPILLRAHFKPTPSVSREQDTVTQTGEPVKVTIGGRHDPVIVPRAVVVVECMCAIALTDALLMNMSARADRIADFYSREVTSRADMLACPSGDACGSNTPPL